MKRHLAIVLALCIVASLAVIPISVQASEGAIQPTSTPVVAPSTITIRVNIINFTYNMPSGRSPGPIYSRWYMTGTVTNKDGVKIATARSGIFWLSDSKCWLDLVIRKNIPEKGDSVSITLDALTYATGNYIDINPDEPLLKGPYDPTGRRLTISYVVGTEQEGWGIGGKSVLTDFDGKLYYKIETLGLPALEPSKGCLLEYSPSSDKEIVRGTKIEIVCKAWNCGDLGGAIEARVFDVKTGETLAANWENRDIGDKSCVVARKRITVDHDLLLGFQASHWDYEHAGWMRDQTKYVTIKLKPTPNFKITNLMVNPSEVKIGEKVSIIADVKNIGDAEGTYNAKIRINGATICSEEVTLSPEETKSVKCYYTPQSEGIYEVEAGGLRRDFNVIRPITPTPTTTATESPTPVPGFEIVSAIAGLLAVAYLLRRK